MSSQQQYDRYLKILIPLFRVEKIDIVQFLCSILHVGDDSDNLTEARHMLEDLVRFNKLDLSPDVFPEPSKTHWRLHLLSYGHLVEMAAPYRIIANLLRVQAKLTYSKNPFNEGDGKAAGKNQLATPSQKITEIKKLAIQAKIPAIRRAYDDIYFSPLRNAIAHSNYALDESEFRMLANRMPSPKNPKVMISVLSLDQLEEIVSKTYDFFTAFFTLERLCREELGKLVKKTLVTQSKANLKVLIDSNGLLNGFHIHWSDGKETIFQRNEEKCISKNIDLI